MKNLFQPIQILFLLLFVACNSDDNVVPTAQPQTGNTLELTVSAADFVTEGAPDTRATDNGKETTFEEDDRVGVIVLNEGGSLLYNNIPYVYKNNKWTFDSNNDEGKGGCYYDTKAKTYIVYYPYSRAADGVTSVDELKTKFAPKFNQSNIKDYRSSDLMVWDNSSLIPPVTTLNAELKHAFASIYLTHTAKYELDDGNDAKGNIKVSDVSLTIDDNVYVPYQATDGSLRCIVPTSINLNSIRCFYTFSGKTYGNTINISDPVANTRYISAPEIFSGKYTLNDAKVGDFYCKKNEKEGYLIPSEVALNGDQKNACLGIVMKVGKDNDGEWKDDCKYKLKNSNTEMTTIRGYVLALYNANDGQTCQWGSYGKEVKTNTERYTGFYGYKNTQTIMNYDKSYGNNLQNNFPATYHATTGYEEKYPAPNNSSGWFLPSAGQCWYWFGKKDDIWISMNKAGGDGWSNYSWSSSENSNNPTNYAWFVDFYFGAVNSPNKDDYNYVRSCLAF